jgi:hypothetical protein
MVRKALEDSHNQTGVRYTCVSAPDGARFCLVGVSSEPITLSNDRCFELPKLM